MVSPDKQALDAVVFEALGLSAEEREAVVQALVGRSRSRREKAQSVEGRAKVSMRSVTDDDVITYGLAETIGVVGLRRFPDDFPGCPTDEVELPAAHGFGEVPKVEVMMDRGTLVWRDGSHVELDSLDAAECVAMLLALEWSEPVNVPRERADARKLLSELDGYVSVCRVKFDDAL